MTIYIYSSNNNNNLFLFVYIIISLAIEIAAGFSDGYIANANNFFLYDNLQDKRFTYLAADFDTTLGNTLVTLSKQLNGNYTDYPGFTLRPLTTKLIQVPAFKLQLETLLQQITKELMNPNVANKRIDELVAFLREDVEWDYRLPKAANASWDDIKDQVPFTPDMIPPPLDWAAIEELMKRQPLTMEQAVYGPTGSNLYPNVVEWFTTLSNNMQQYFNQHPPSSN